LSDSKPVCNYPNAPIGTPDVSLSYLANLHSQQQHNSPPKGGDQQNSVSDFSLSDLASMYLNKSPSLDIDELHGIPLGGGRNASSSAAPSSLADLASLHTSTGVVRPHEEADSNSLSLSELASLHMSDQSMPTCSQLSEYLHSPVLETNPTATTGLDFSAGFATPKTGSTLSLSQLASLGTKPVPNSTVPSQTSTVGLAALATAHFSSMVSSYTEINNPVDLKSMRPPPGFKVSEERVLKTSEDISLSAVVKKLTIQEPDVDVANASQFATILCMPEKQRSKKLGVRHRHLRKRSWKKIFRLHLHRFSFATPSPDDFILNKQKRVFTSDLQ